MAITDILDPKYTHYITQILLLIGCFNVLCAICKALVVFLQTFVIPGTSLKEFGAGKGAWAVVTGASDGIGAEFAIQLAEAGFSIMLVGRNRVKLEAVEQRIKSSEKGSTISTKICITDFSRRDEEAYAEFMDLCKDLDVGVLVNNVGRSHDMPVYFVDTLKQDMDDICTINITGTLRVTHAILPGMIEKKRGLILNVGSFAGSVPSPMLATYSGSKAFISTFSTALAEEVRKQNITVHHINPFFVVSKMSKTRPSTLAPLPKPYVRSVLAKIDLPCGAVCTGRPGTSTPYWSHALLDWVVGVVGWKWGVVWVTHGVHGDVRRRALRKLERVGRKRE